jgi:hypothetical protein
MAGKTIYALAAAVFACSLPLLATGQANLQGLYLPTYISWDNNGHVIVAEKAGVIKIFDGFQGQGRVLLDIQNLVANYGKTKITIKRIFKGDILPTRR